MAVITLRYRFQGTKDELFMVGDGKLKELTDNLEPRCNLVHKSCEKNSQDMELHILMPEMR